MAHIAEDMSPESDLSLQSWAFRLATRRCALNRQNRIEALSAFGLAFVFAQPLFPVPSRACRLIIGRTNSGMFCQPPLRHSCSPCHDKILMNARSPVENGAGKPATDCRMHPTSHCGPRPYLNGQLSLKPSAMSSRLCCTTFRAMCSVSPFLAITYVRIGFISHSGIFPCFSRHFALSLPACSAAGFAADC